MTPLNTQQLTETLDVLAHPYRRYSLYHLTAASEPVYIKDLVNEIVGRDRSDTAPNNLTQSVKTALYHTHLPKLADAGVITVNTNTETVKLRETDGVSRFLDQMAEIDDRYVESGDVSPDVRLPFVRRQGRRPHDRAGSQEEHVTEISNKNIMSDSRDADGSESRGALLGHPHRRISYKLLIDHRTMALADLADEIAVWEEDSSLEQIPAEDVLVIYTALYDTHVPILERAGIVKCDQDRDLVSLTGYGTSVPVDMSVYADEVTNSSTEGSTFEEESADGETVTVELDLETINAIHRALMTDERLDKQMSYDDVIRAVLTEAYT